ncbi:MAG: 6-carboxytetrahydropterin synthase [Thermoanaerobaculia bacterium]
MILFERTYQFSSSHLYWRDDWSDERNRATFGKCAIRPAHGHNYRLTIRLRGEVDPETGFLIDLGELDRMVRERVVDRLDHRHVNEVVPEFAEGERFRPREPRAVDRGHAAGGSGRPGDAARGPPPGGGSHRGDLAGRPPGPRVLGATAIPRAGLAGRRGRGGERGGGRAGFQFRIISPIR